jgi:hypothetical protein
MKLKNDRYRKARGGKAFWVNLFCSSCGSKILLYQKDGDGMLKRCYFNRIFWPQQYEKLQHERSKDVEKYPPLSCESCGEVIGMPITHHDGRLAYRLRQGSFTKKRQTR